MRTIYTANNSLWVLRRRWCGGCRVEMYVHLRRCMLVAYTHADGSSTRNQDATYRLVPNITDPLIKGLIPTERVYMGECGQIYALVEYLHPDASF